MKVPIMDGLSAARAIGAMVASGERPYAPIVVRVRTRAALYALPAAMHACTCRRLMRCACTQALTASCSDEERARCAAAGMAELLPKPISLVKVQARRRACSFISLRCCCQRLFALHACACADDIPCCCASWPRRSCCSGTRAAARMAARRRAVTAPRCLTRAVQDRVTSDVNSERTDRARHRLCQCDSQLVDGPSSFVRDARDLETIQRLTCCPSTARPVPAAQECAPRRAAAGQAGGSSSSAAAACTHEACTPKARAHAPSQRSCGVARGNQRCRLLQELMLSQYT
jgi:CheY-like chemotaxis protein